MLVANGFFDLAVPDGMQLVLELLRIRSFTDEVTRYSGFMSSTCLEASGVMEHKARSG